MAYIITNECIGCDRCSTVCPTGAIQKLGERQYQINSDRCNNCITFYSVPQCWAICPTNAGCTPRVFLPTAHEGTSGQDYWDRWFSTYQQAMIRMQQTHPSDEYWSEWFESYTQRVSHLLRLKLDKAIATQ